jgi:hypothetical protein
LDTRFFGSTQNLLMFGARDGERLLNEGIPLSRKGGFKYRPPVAYRNRNQRDINICTISQVLFNLGNPKSSREPGGSRSIQIANPLQFHLAHRSENRKVITIRHLASSDNSNLDRLFAFFLEFVQC